MPKTEFKNGIEVPLFNHDTNDVLEALGYSTDEYQDVIKHGNAIAERIRDQPKYAQSKVYEATYNEMSKMELLILLANERLGRQLDQRPLESILDALGVMGSEDH